MSGKYGKKNIASNISWKLVERLSSLIVSLVTNVILARILLPSDFGLLAMINVFVSIMTIFVTSGVSNSLIQKKESDSLDFSSLFWFNLFISAVLYIVLFVLAPYIADFYGNLVLTPMLRVLSLQIPISAIYIIQGAYISKHMLFKYYFFSTLSSKILSGVLGITLALTGFGVWSLIVQSLSLIFFETIVLWIKIDWRPERIFSWRRVRKLFPFAFKLMLRSFVESISTQLRTIFIGNNYTSSQLAFYDRGNLFPNTITTNISTSTSSVMFPVLADSQENQKQVLNICRRWIKLFSYILFNLLIGLFLIAKPFTEILLTEKWLPSVPYLQIASLVFMTWAIESPIRETLKSMGYSNVLLKMEIYKTVISILILIITVSEGVLMIAYGTLFAAMINVLISLLYASKYIGYRISLILKDLFPNFILMLLMILTISLVINFIPITSSILDLLIRIFVGVSTFILGSLIFKNENFFYLVDLIKQFVQKK